MSNENELSKKRTKWSEDRTLLSAERTFSSWMSSGMGAIGIAIGLKAVFGAFEPTWVAKLVATAFLAIAILIFWAARDQACKSHSRLNQNDLEIQPPHRFTILASLLTVSTLGVCVVLWLL